jgi:exo-1,4-beta-D-glucosaminidase
MTTRIAPATSFVVLLLFAAATPMRLGAQDIGAPARYTLHDGWFIQSSARITSKDAAIAETGFSSSDWYPATVPSTVVGALVTDKVYPDPYYAMNLRSIPGATYPIAANFSKLPMPEGSPFLVPWWYRTTFRVPADMRGKRLALHFDGINYRANIWLNGRQLANSDQVAGTFRVYEFDITGIARAGGDNVLAVEVSAPTQDDLALTFVDWNPAPPDKDMGLWHDVYLTASYDVTVRNPHVFSTVDTSTLRSADLTVTAELHNRTAHAVSGTLRGKIDKIAFSRPVTLRPHDSTVVRFTTTRYPQLRIANPRLWWPAEMGKPELYDLDLRFDAGGSTSDRRSVRFGIRQITSEFTAQGGRVFKVNGRRILIRGGGWAPDMMLRPNPERQEAEIRYVRDLNLNTIRLEGKLEDDHFYELADRYGVLVLAGWCCCDMWEMWPKWKKEHYQIAAQSQRDQIRRLRNHPSVLAWLNGSDNPPPADVEKIYVDILKEYEWQNPFISSATAKKTEVTGASGVKMTGPYDWVPPAYWLVDKTRGGAHGFNTETSPGAAVPPIESIRSMVPADHLWPVDSVWNYHGASGQFKSLQPFQNAVAARYGPSNSAEDFTVKSQLMTYEGERAMFEAFARNKYVSTGVIQWMLNNGWPSMFWHLYDYYLRPGGGYYGTKKACEPLHVQYSYDDRSIVAVNGTGQRVPGLKVRASVLNMDLAVRFSKEATIDLSPDTSAQLFTIPEMSDLSGTYFLDLRLTDANGQAVSTNFYWLATKMDVLDFDKSTWYATPVQSYADYSALQGLPAAVVQATTQVARTADREEARVTLTNSGNGLAFFVRLQVMKSTDGEELLPVLWQDNYITLLPGETREIHATYQLKDLGAAKATVVVSGWNVGKTLAK